MDAQRIRGSRGRAAQDWLNSSSDLFRHAGSVPVWIHQDHGEDAAENRHDAENLEGLCVSDGG